MNDSFLREPQVELFFQAYFIGLALGHLAFFFDDIGFMVFIPKFNVSLPIVFVLFVFYRVKYIEINSRPFLWSSIIFTVILLLIVAAFLLLSGGSIQRLTLLAFFPYYFYAFYPCRVYLLPSYDQAATKEKSRLINSRRRDMPAEKRRPQGRRYIVD
ncbi:hypothetical protein A4U53_020470 [Rhizobium ruizarguesonis]|uniref:Uncharacterized protein n=1 Tax=Rhizobium ruizarguesonis TaxID=2081791 RepID=A0ACD5ETV4_9HYPH